MSDVFVVVACLAVGAAVAWWWFGRGSKKKKASVPTLRRKLRKLVHDPHVAHRLVEAERDRHPELAEAALLRKVIRRLERDRRG